MYFVFVYDQFPGLYFICLILHGIFNHLLLLILLCQLHTQQLRVMNGDIQFVVSILPWLGLAASATSATAITSEISLDSFCLMEHR